MRGSNRRRRLRSAQVAPTREVDARAVAAQMVCCVAAMKASGSVMPTKDMSGMGDSADVCGPSQGALHAESLKNDRAGVALPNVWRQRRAKRVRCTPGLGHDGETAQGTTELHGTWTGVGRGMSTAAVGGPSPSQDSYCFQTMLRLRRVHSVADGK